MSESNESNEVDEILAKIDATLMTKEFRGNAGTGAKVRPHPYPSFIDVQELYLLTLSVLLRATLLSTKLSLQEFSHYRRSRTMALYEWTESTVGQLSLLLKYFIEVGLGRLMIGEPWTH